MDDGADAEIPDDPRIRALRRAGRRGATRLDFSGRVTDERQAAAICYTTGTTGNPKGVALHATARRGCTRCAILTTGGFALSEADRVLPVVPMFHANAWGMPYAAFLAGASLVMPGPDLSARRA